MSAVCAVDNPQLLQVDAKVHKLFINVFFKRENKHLEAEYRLKQPIVGIGAPANAWLRKAARQMGAEYFISEHSPIAGAVGAAAGKRKD